MMSFLKIVLLGCIVAYVGFGMTVYFMPHLFLYHPDIIKPNIDKMREKIPEIKEVSLSDASDAYGWYVPTSNAQKVVVFFHGNSDNCSYFLNRAKPFVDNGYAVLMVEYQGFAGRKGKPNQTSMERDVRSAVAFLNGQGFENKDIILYGHSMGTYLAVYGASELGQQNPFNAVILEAPFTSVADVADKASFYLFPVRLLLYGNTYDSMARIHHINTRLLIGHGVPDKVVPYVQGEKLFEKASKPKEFFSSAEAGHRELPAYGFISEILSFLRVKE
ncbi:MAG: alpha/beta fold hydrolase [Alphaproteobacteria bacterium]|nr:alpha/beta fold hydrolase [Alphaproteobacteria bacterium]